MHNWVITFTVREKKQPKNSTQQGAAHRCLTYMLPGDVLHLARIVSWMLHGESGL